MAWLLGGIAAAVFQLLAAQLDVVRHVRHRSPVQPGSTATPLVRGPHLVRRSVDQLGESAEIELRAVLPQGVEFIAEFRSQPVEEAGAVRNLRPEPGDIAELIAKGGLRQAS